MLSSGFLTSKVRVLSHLFIIGDVDLLAEFLLGPLDHVLESLAIGLENSKFFFEE